MPPRAKQSSIALAILIVLATLFVIGAKASQPANAALGTEEKVSLVTVPTIKETGRAGSSFVTDAYIIGKYDCLACPTGADCRICPERDSAIIIDSAGPSSPETPMLSTQMIVYSDAGKYLHLGQRFRLRLFLEPSTSTTSPQILRAKVIGYVEIGI
ncbi:MAG: hypothetical protein NTY66_03860 [Candidatus Vogelbacteria bacterium]|nr:hypothetical protein [Candidatus Vogelbacteria bacterium]